MSALVSVVIPCFKQARYVEDCVASLRAQTFPHWEAIVIDDGSPDDTAEIVAKITAVDSRVRMISQPNRGRSAAKNAGMRAVRGGFVQFLDADDLLPPRKFELHVAALEAEGASADIIYSNAWYFPDGQPNARARSGFGENGNEDWITTLANDGRPVVEKLVYKNILPICAPLMRRTAMEAAGFFDENLNVLEDWEYWFRCAGKGLRFKFMQCEDADVLIRLHAASISQDRAAMNAGNFAMRLAVLRYLPDRHVRRLLLAESGKIMAASHAPPNEISYRELSQVVSGWDETLAVWVAKVCGPRNTRCSALEALVRSLPWRLRVLADS